MRFDIFGDLFLLNSQTAGLLSVESARLTNEHLTELIGHILLVLFEDTKEIASENSQVLLLEELGVDLRKRVKSGVDLVLRDRALVANQALKLVDLILILGLEAINVLLGDLHI